MPSGTPSSRMLSVSLRRIQVRGSTQGVYAEKNASTSWQGVQADWFPINDGQVAKGEGFQAGDYGGSKWRPEMRKAGANRECHGPTGDSGQIRHSAIGRLAA